MNIAVMQPYFIPYLGYFQLINKVDKFIILDDVNYINRGWINRNKIKAPGGSAWLTLPLVGASQNRLIQDIEISPDTGWKKKADQMVVSAYSAAPQSEDILPLWQSWLQAASGNLSVYLTAVLSDICAYLDITTEIVPSSSVFPKGGKTGQRRILDICQLSGASTYINPPGGRDLYDASLFEPAGIELFFLQPNLAQPGLRSGLAGDMTTSILDLLMYTPRAILSDAAKGGHLDAG